MTDFSGLLADCVLRMVRLLETPAAIPNNACQVGSVPMPPADQPGPGDDDMTFPKHALCWVSEKLKYGAVMRAIAPLRARPR